MGLDLKQLCFAVPHRLYANNTPLLIAFLHMIFTPIICEDNAHTTQNLSSKKLQTAMDNIPLADLYTRFYFPLELKSSHW